MAVTRKPIITVLGHVDSGKSTLLDTIRGTDVVAKEAGGITQHIGATEVPISIVKKISGALLESYKFDLKIPGLLFIDTPGHEAFANLRKRGGSIADLAVVVVDVMKGLQNQTEEAIDILRTYKTPFIVVANKIDSISGYKTAERSFAENIKMQNEQVRQILDEKIYRLVGQLHEKGFASERYDRVEDFTKEIPIVPASARKGEGIPEVLMFLAGLSQKYLEEKLAVEVKGPGKGTILEVKEERGLGKTIDVIIYDGTIKTGQQIVLGGKQGVIETKVKALLEPKALEEMRVSQEKFKTVRDVHAAAGVKIAGSGLENALSGSPVFVVEKGNEASQISDELGSLKIESEAVGPLVRADTLGSLEAMVKLLQDKGIKIRRADIGDVSRRDIMEMEGVMEKDRLKGVVFAFNCPITGEAEEEIKKSGVKVFCGKVIYKLLEEYEEWVAQEDERKKAEKIAKLVMPARIRLLPGNVFRNCKPAIVGVRVIAGRLRAGVDLMKEGKVVGKVKVIQKDGKTVEEARDGDEVAVSIEGANIGRNVMENDELYTYIPKRHLAELEQSEDLLTAPEVELVGEIKKLEANTAKASA